MEKKISEREERNPEKIGTKTLWVSHMLELGPVKESQVSVKKKKKRK